MNAKLILFAALGVLALAAQAGADTLNGLAKGGSRARAPIEGTWLVATSPYDCSTGIEFPVPPIGAYLTFGAGGTLLEANANPNFDAGQRSPGHGYWERTGRRYYRAIVQAFILFDNAGYTRGHQRFDHGIELQDLEHWTSDATVSFFDVAGNNLGSGCARASAERMN